MANKVGMNIRIDGEVREKLESIGVEKGLVFSNHNNIIRILLGLEPLPGPRHSPSKGAMDLKIGEVRK